MKVLLIEDSREIVETVAATIKLKWSEVDLLSTSFGKEGMELVKKESPDIVVLDLGLPDVDGFEVLHQIRTFSQVPLVILTIFRNYWVHAVTLILIVLETSLEIFSK